MYIDSGLCKSVTVTDTIIRGRNESNQIGTFILALVWTTALQYEACFADWQGSDAAVAVLGVRIKRWRAGYHWCSDRAFVGQTGAQLKNAVEVQ
mmetsp:Transcript_9180/g.13548  ORF Transcript_9180/g.13548 Transcript_9180/m.13548 type:complete len:94 (+) Transcript_9180:130-411(+)